MFVDRSSRVVPRVRWEDIKWLMVLVAINILSTIVHYVHNIIYFAEYPEPPWMTRLIIDSFWFLMTPFAFLGLHWDLSANPTSSFWAFVTYCVMSETVLLHYACEIKTPISMSIHFNIWFEAIAAFVLLIYVTKRYMNSKKVAK